MAMLNVLGRMELRDRNNGARLHAVRPFSTWANETGAVRPDVIEASLGAPRGDKVRAAYNRAEFADERRAPMSAMGHLSLASQCDGANVDPI